MSFTYKIKKFIEAAQLSRHFKRYFKVVPALTDELVLEAQKIRHMVYCEELGWEPINANRREEDKFDKHSHHCLLKSVSSGLYIGCIRLVLPSEQDAGQVLPFQLSCHAGLDVGHPDADAMKAGSVAEVSRLAIVQDYRRRRGEEDRPAAIEIARRAGVDRRKFPYLPVGLYLGMMHMAALHGIDRLYFLTEPVLARHFSMLGGQLTPVGQAIEHRGKRVPYVMDVQKVLGEANFFLRPLIKEIGREVRAQYK